MRLICERCAAVAVDYQERLLPPIRGRERLMKKSAELLEGLSLLSVPVLFTEQYPQGLGKTDPALLALAPGAPVIEKTSFGAADTPVATTNGSPVPSSPRRCARLAGIRSSFLGLKLTSASCRRRLDSKSWDTPPFLRLTVSPPAGRGTTLSRWSGPGRREFC